MDEFIVDVNRSLSFQDTVQRLRYKPEDPYIKTIDMGIRVRNGMEDNDFIAYIECRIWNIASQKENTFWNYAYEYEKNQEDKPFSAVCGYLGKTIKSTSLIKGKKPMVGWAVFISEFKITYSEVDKIFLNSNLLFNFVSITIVSNFIFFIFEIFLSVINIIFSLGKILDSSSFIYGSFF